MRELLRDQFRLLTFRTIRPDLDRSRARYWVYVLIVTWIVGVGRYWDHPSAEPWQYAGLGSVIYIFVLSTFLWLIVWPMRPKNWSFENVFLFVGMTSLPAVLYAIPVERFLTLEDAQTVNAAFLGVVAIWRIALYVRFLVGAAGLTVLEVIVATLLPLSAIVVVLAILNLEHVVFNIMAGIREGDESPYDTSYSVVLGLAILSFYALPVTGVMYLITAMAKSARTREDGSSDE